MEDRCVCCGQIIPEGKQVCKNCEEKINNKEGKAMNNETIKRFDITIKLRGDHVYDLYIDNEWIASRGNLDNILEEAKVFLR